MIGRKTEIVVQHEDKAAKKRLRYASARDIRRGTVDQTGVSAETLKLILRHSNFATAEKSYGAVKDAQAAAAEIHRLSNRSDSKSNDLSETEVAKLRMLLENI